MSLTVSSPTRVSMMSLPTMISPALGLNGFTSRSHERRRAPSLFSSAMRLAFTKTRRRWTDAEKPMTSGGSAPREGRSTMSFELPDGDAIGGEQGQAHHPERIDEVASHASEATSAPQASLRRRTTEGAAAATAKPAIIAPASWRERRTAAAMSLAVGARPRPSAARSSTRSP